MLRDRQEILEAASTLAKDCFENNLLLSFIGGSHAKGAPRQNSDVDSFVVLEQPDRTQEAAYFRQFQQLHLDNQLAFAHCGELFDKNTLEDLISYTTEIREKVPEVRHAGCYDGDCLFSVFRKGAVVMGFLNDPKLFVHGDVDYLLSLEARAARFVKDFPLTYGHHENGHSEMTLPPVIAYGNKILQKDNLEDTPVGIGLERWFRHPFGEFHSDRAPLEETIGLAKSTGVPAHKACPLAATFADTQKEMLFRQQCLAVKGTARNRSLSYPALKQ